MSPTVGTMGTQNHPVLTYMVLYDYLSSQPKFQRNRSSGSRDIAILRVWPLEGASVLSF